MDNRVGMCGCDKDRCCIYYLSSTYMNMDMNIDMI